MQSQARRKFALYPSPATGNRTSSAAAKAGRPRGDASGSAGAWHVDCIAADMSNDKQTALLLGTICVLTFACGVAALTQHPEWFGA